MTTHAHAHTHKHTDLGTGASIREKYSFYSPIFEGNKTHFQTRSRLGVSGSCLHTDSGQRGSTSQPCVVCADRNPPPRMLRHAHALRSGPSVRSVRWSAMPVQMQAPNRAGTTLTRQYLMHATQSVSESLPVNARCLPARQSTHAVADVFLFLLPFCFPPPSSFSSPCPPPFLLFE